MGPRMDCFPARPEDELVLLTFTEDEEEEVVLCSLELGSQPSTINKKKKKKEKMVIFTENL